MLQRRTNSDWMVKRTLLFCGLVFVAVLVLLPIAAGAQCPTRWDAGGVVHLRQRGQQFAIELTLQHRGKVITGTASHNAKTPGPGSGGVRRVEGTVDGTIEGDSFNIQIFWPDDLTGVYAGKVLPSGRLEGETYDKNNSRNRQPWHSEGVLRCAPNGALMSGGFIPPFGNNTPPAPRPKSNTTAPPTPAIRGIVADPAIFATPYERYGNVTLKWNVGQDHLHAELWVKINRGPDVFVAKQGWSSSRQVMVERNHHYIYILREAGTILAAVEFVAR